MPDFPPGHIYNGEPCDALYWRYSLRCRVEREEDKAYYWPQLRALNDMLQQLVSGWKDLRLFSDQALDLAIWQGVLPEAEADALARRIGKLSGAKHLWKAESGFKGEAYTDPADGNHKLRHSVYDEIEGAVEGCNRYGARWVDLLECSE